jgi:hypothetical protein
MKTYKIYRWDPIIMNNQNDIKIIVYIYPDDNLLEFSNNQNNMLKCKIFNTNTIYDEVLIDGSINTSGVIPNFRPNFFNTTQLYVIKLDATWNGYPRIDSLGEIGFIGLD